VAITSLVPTISTDVEEDVEFFSFSVKPHNCSVSVRDITSNLLVVVTTHIVTAETVQLMLLEGLELFLIILTELFEWKICPRTLPN
jgi:hypothetical protein